jgi:hypothetical protein
MVEQLRIGTWGSVDEAVGERVMLEGTGGSSDIKTWKAL